MKKVATHMELQTWHRRSAMNTGKQVTHLCWSVVHEHRSLDIDMGLDDIIT
jgi:hypothetical protein